MQQEDNTIPDEDEFPDEDESLRGFRHPGLKCQVESIQYNFLDKEGILYMPSHNCCDMDGCVSFFKSIDENVCKIQTFTDKQPDMCYVLTDSGWTARMFNWKKS